MNRALLLTFSFSFVSCLLLVLACGSENDSGSSSSSGSAASDSGASSTSSSSSSSSSSGDGGGGDAGAGDGGDAGADASDSGGLKKYDSNGAALFTSVQITPSGMGTLLVVVPNAPGKYPVVSLSPGLLQPVSPYLAYAGRLASYGIITVMRDDPGLGLGSTAQVQNDITWVVTTWLPAENARAGSPLEGKVDLTKIGLAGHSRGGKASLLAAENGLKGKIVAWFGLDPVDSVIPGDNTKARDTLATIGVPIAMLGAEVASTCSPAGDTFAALYAAAASPSALVIGKGAGHTQLEDPASCNQCNLCSPAGTADGAVVLAYSIRYLTAFFARELLGDATVGASFAGAGAGPDIAAGHVAIMSK